MRTQTELRRIEIQIDHDIFGFDAEVTQQLNTISAVRVKKGGTRSYLPNYTSNMNDAMLILQWCKDCGGDGYLWTSGDEGWKCRLIVDGHRGEATSGTATMAICEAASVLMEWRAKVP